MNDGCYNELAKSATTMITENKILLVHFGQQHVTTVNNNGSNEHNINMSSHYCTNNEWQETHNMSAVSNCHYL